MAKIKVHKSTWAWTGVNLQPKLGCFWEGRIKFRSRQRYYYYKPDCSVYSGNRMLFFPVQCAHFSSFQNKIQFKKILPIHMPILAWQRQGQRTFSLFIVSLLKGCGHVDSSPWLCFDSESRNEHCMKENTVWVCDFAFTKERARCSPWQAICQR